MKRFLSVALLSLAAAVPTRPAEASPEVREKFTELAKRIVDTTKGQPVTVGIFSQTGLPDSNAGPGLEGILTDELNRLQSGIVSVDAKYEVKGDYAYARPRGGDETGLKVIKVKVRIIEKEFSEDLLTVPLDVTLDQTRTVAEMLQVTASLPPEGSKTQRNQMLDQSLQRPSVHIHGPGRTLVSSSAGSPYSVEVLVRPAAGGSLAAAPRSARAENGLAYVDIQRGELYEVRIHNRSGADVAVAVSIDGLGAFHFADARHRGKDGRPIYNHFIVYREGYVLDGQPYDGTGTIVGWFQKLAPPDNYLSFLVTGYGQGAVSKAGIKARGKVGQIHAQFSKCYPLRDGANPRSGNETGFGPPRSVRHKAVRYEIEPPHEFVTIRYTRPQE